MAKVYSDPSLFEVSAKVPDGFIYQENFISESEESELIREIQTIQLTPFKYYQFTGKRRTATFGWQYEFGSSEITTAPDVPAFLYRSGHVPETSLASIRTVWFKHPSLNILSARRLAGIEISRILA